MMKKNILFAIVLFVSTLSISQSIRLADNIQKINYGADPYGTIEYNGVLYFSASTTEYGHELLKYDGTSFSLVQDINPGVGNSYCSYFTIYNGELFFVANDGVTGTELWKYDGTSASLVQEVNVGPANGNIRELIVYNGELFFYANDGVVGEELFKYDGTSVSLVQDIVVGATGSYPQYFTVYNSELYFNAYDPATGVELWKYNGTSATIVQDLRPGNSSSNPNYLEVYNGELYFSANNGTTGTELWKYDGTSISLVQDYIVGAFGANPTHMKSYNGSLYFNLYSDTTGYELYKYDGTITSLVQDINPGLSNSDPQFFYEYNGELFFRAKDGTFGRELWKYDGVSATLVQDIYSGSSNSDPIGFVGYNGDLYFTATDLLYGNELRKYDGTNVSLVVDILKQNSGSGPRYLTHYNGELYFTADDGIVGRELWKYNGDSAVLVADIYPGSTSSGIEYLVVYNGELYFKANDGINGIELFKYDGTSVSVAADMAPGAASSYPLYLTVYNGSIYFRAYDPTNGDELWMYDGTTASIAQDIYPGSNSSGLSNLYVHNGELFFRAANDTSGNELFKYDGTTLSLINIRLGSSSSNPSSLQEYNGALYFSANDGTTGTELWKYDGVSASLVQDIIMGISSSGPSGFSVYNGKLYFSANDGINGTEPWVYDGTTATLLQDIRSGSGGSFPYLFIEYNGELFFNANNGVNGNELWKYDGTSIVFLKDINPGSNSGGPANFAISNGVLFFVADDGFNGGELWRLMPYIDSTISSTVCDSVVSPSGNYTWTTTGTYYDTVADTIYTLNLSIASFPSVMPITVTNSILCDSGVSIIQLDSTEVNYKYFLYDSIANSFVDGPLEGNGDSLLLSTGVIDSSGVYFVVSIANNAEFGVRLPEANDYINFTNPYSTYNKSITIESWVYADTGGTVDLWAGQSSPLIDNPTTNVWLWHQNTFYLNDAGTWRTAIFPSLSPGWTHVATVADTTGVYVYYNGQLQSTGSGITTGIVQNGGSVIQLGQDPRFPAGTPTRNGDIGFSNFRVWNAARTQEEINNNMILPVSGAEPGLVHATRFYEWTGDTLASITGPTGYVVNSNPTQWIGKESGCYGFVSQNNIHVTVNSSTTASFTQTVCDSLVSPSGNYTWTSTGIYMDTISNSIGCDSVMTINLTVNNSFHTFESLGFCEGDSIMIAGNWIYVDTVVTDSLLTSTMCDSIVTYTISELILTPTLDLGGDRLACNNDTVIINSGVYDTYLWNTGDITPSITIDANITGIGNFYYWVEVTDTNIGCSAKDSIKIEVIQCISIGIEEALNANLIKVYPNPITGEEFTIDFTDYEEECTIEVLDITGKVFSKTNRQNKASLLMNIDGERGVYFIKFTSKNNNIGVVKLIKQ